MNKKVQDKNQKEVSEREEQVLAETEQKKRLKAYEEEYWKTARADLDAMKQDEEEEPGWVFCADRV